MSDNRNDPPEEPKTVFMPGGLPPAAPTTSVEPAPPSRRDPAPASPEPPAPSDWEQMPAPPADAPADPWGQPTEPPLPAATPEVSWEPAPASPPPPVPPSQEETAFAPTAVPPLQAPSPPPLEPTAAPTSPTMRAGTFANFTPRADGKSIEVGDVLNHIFEVKRFIARGGMGEVFEGINVNTDERVAIKVMLPALAADANVIAMFRKEARTLTRLQHEALVNYRVLAQEPNLGVLYIVTEFVEGANLADVLGEIRPGAAELTDLLRRLASGLRAAHALGAIHRDISPDNVLLEGGRLDKPKIIDFGIAKDLDPGSATIVGEGFAGKLNYVAPEQLGDFGREVGPWSDIYSLALVILAVAQGRNVQMGGSLVDAVDKRRAGPDMAGAPDELRDVLGKMLKPNPAERFRSMDEVLAALDMRGKAAAPPELPREKPKVTATIREPQKREPEKTGGSKLPLLIGAVVALLLIAGGAWFLLKPSGEPAETAVASGEPARSGAPATADPVSAAREAVAAALPQLGCSWLNADDVAATPNGVKIKMSGVAGDPAAAQGTVMRAVQAKSGGTVELDFEDVAQISTPGCTALDTYRQVSTSGSQRLTVPQHKFEMRLQPASSAYAGKLAANIVLEANVGDPAKDFALVGIEPTGRVQREFSGDGQGVFDRAQLTALAKDAGGMATDLGNDRYKLQFEVDQPGWTGVLLLTGQGPFTTDLVGPKSIEDSADWSRRFLEAARAKGWTADIIWFRPVDETPE